MGMFDVSPGLESAPGSKQPAQQSGSVGKASASANRYDGVGSPNRPESSGYIWDPESYKHIEMLEARADDFTHLLTTIDAMSPKERETTNAILIASMKKKVKHSTRRVLMGFRLIYALDANNISAAPMAGQVMNALAPAERRTVLDWVQLRTANAEFDGLVSEVKAPVSPFAGASLTDRVHSKKPVKAGKWDLKPNPKTGETQPANFYIGNAAHEAIAKSYIVKHPGETVETNAVPLSSVLNKTLDEHPKKNQSTRKHKKTDAEGLGKAPDIANVTTREIYEIKPETDLAGARTKLQMYLATLAEYGYPYKPGDSSAAGTMGILPAPAGYIAFESPEPGVILYKKKMGDYEPEPVPVADKKTSDAGEPVTSKSYATRWWETIKVVAPVAAAVVVVVLVTPPGWIAAAGAAIGAGISAGLAWAF